MRLLALVDCDNFYASCERVFRPDLKQVPIVVLSNNDGCVIARSKEAKAMGIKMGIPWFKVKKSYLAQGGKVFLSNFALYGDLSKRVMNILEGMVKKIEIYSIDEAFLDLQHIQNTNHAHEFGVTVATLYDNGLVFLYELESRQQKLLPRLQAMLQEIQVVAWEFAA